MANLGVVAIGRNEGERLRRCLDSAIGRCAKLVYVDSGSTDGSVAMALDKGVDVVELDTSVPFTAARARNAGVERLLDLAPDLEFLHVVDGDCEFVDGWFEAATQEMNGNPRLAAVCGRLRERRPDASIYNRLCDMEWNTQIGEVNACGGIALIRVESFQQVEGYRESLIAGEEPEMCFRLRAAGWRIKRIDHDMALHDAGMTRFSQWWRRCMRGGWACAEGAAMHGSSPEKYKQREIMSVWFWGLVLPLGVLMTAWATKGLSLLALLGYGVLGYRVYKHRRERGDAPSRARVYAIYCVASKFPMLVGALKFQLNRLRGRRAHLIEYKGPATEVSC